MMKNDDTQEMQDQDHPEINADDDSDLDSEGTSVDDHLSPMLQKPNTQSQLDLDEELFSIIEQHPLRAMVAIATEGTTTDNTPIDLFLPEPNSFKALLCLPLEIRKLWMKAIEDEIKTLINNDTFDLDEKPRHGEQVIPIKLVCKAKQRSDGFLDKLKVRAVQRGDLQWYKPEEDTWSPCASSWGLRLYFAELARRRRRGRLLDFIGAFLQGRAVGRHFVRFPPDLAEYFPQFAKYFGVAMMLKRGMYGGTLSGKWWNQELTDWLISEGFLQSSIDNTYFVKYYPDGSFIRLIFHVDDMLYFGNNDEIEQQFEASIKGRFNVNILGQAHWFLQMRIHHHADGCISIDQHRYVLNLLQRFCNTSSPYGIPKFRDTPAPPEYVFTKENRPSTQQDHDEISSKYPGLDFRSCLCTILYLAYSTRADILLSFANLQKHA